ncbi:acetyl xylan esterase [Streptomyces orinoci]|uniref:Acyl carrier protein n=1 Tax=Streptomyces orinoci TaxID=67339 RepID=A0ABV3K9X9_STRON|nr:acetyl xylan esterase [Streptomyces orinoci]
MRSEQEFRDQLRSWIRSKSGEGETAALTDGTALFEERYLRSVHLPELLLLLERLCGEPIDVEELSPRDFRSIDAMVRRYARSGVAS